MKIEAKSFVYSFSKNHKPIAHVKAGDTVDIDALDAFANQLRNEGDKIDSLDWDKVNAATGPIFIEGAEDGDILKVKINKITLDNKGTVLAGENFGLLGHLLKGSHVKIVHIKDGFAEFSDSLKLPLNPMIGVIGVAPEGEDINTGTPGKHGGNMDNLMVNEGAVLYFQVKTSGALFSLGDIHAVMGDGEIGVSGLEIPATVNVTFDIIKNKKIEHPILENEEFVTVIASALTSDEAAEIAVEEMFKLLSGKISLSDPEIAMLMSLVGQLQICQMVDPLKTVRFVMRKEHLNGLGVLELL
ncbi:MAG: acetamidase/formamidase family protein [Defluviitaleaceae bacterium]|nr:acetamidase/formamidase family protein [Defluviitaleaceae bacterium]